MTIALLVIGDGRKDKLVQAVESARQNLIGDIVYRVMINDSAGEAPGYEKYLIDRFSNEFKVISQKREGLAGAIRSGWAEIHRVIDLGDLDIEYVFHLEEDFVFETKIDLNKMINILKVNPYLAQLSLKRAPVNPAEQEAGGWMQQQLHLYKQQDGYVEQQHLFTLNPCLYPMKTVQAGWPEHGGEREFTDRIQEVNPETRFGILGGIDSAPLITHIGSHRSENWTL